MNKSNSSGSNIISQEDILFYQEHGWFISKPLIHQDIIDDALFGFERYCAGERDAVIPLGICGEVDIQSLDSTAQLDYLSLQIDEIKELVHNPLIGEMASLLASTDSVRLYHDQMILKPGHLPQNAGNVGFHTDTAYWKSCTSKDMISAWLPLTECNRENGTMVVIDKSHRWKGNDGLLHFHNRDIDHSRERIVSSGEEIKEIYYDVKPGQVCFHHCRTIHGSYQNNSAVKRLSLAIHMQDHSNTYKREYIDNKLVSHLTEKLCKINSSGDPDYTDSLVYPQLWPQTGEG